MCKTSSHSPTFTVGMKCMNTCMYVHDAIEAHCYGTYEGRVTDSWANTEQLINGHSKAFWPWRPSWLKHLTVTIYQLLHVRLRIGNPPLSRCMYILQSTYVSSECAPFSSHSYGLQKMVNSSTWKFEEKLITGLCTWYNNGVRVAALFKLRCGLRRESYLHKPSIICTQTAGSISTDLYKFIRFN